jgi:putative tryptophan/tyrosine transport system substrate-binding protein
MRRLRSRHYKRLISLLLFSLAWDAGAFAVGKTWNIAIVEDTTQDFSTKTREGFVATLDGLLAKRGDKASYAVYNTELSEAKAAGIVESIKSSSPDLIFEINNPMAFADMNVAAKLKAPKYRFVSENCLPVQSGVAKSWDRPGGNITGVSIFVKFNAQIRLMRRIKPEAKNLVMFTWSAVKLLNDWYEEEVRRACREEKVELVEFARVPSLEAELAFFAKYADAGKDFFMSGVVSAWVHEDGRPADADVVRLEGAFVRDRLRVPIVCYDEVALMGEGLAGACVIWSDIGAQAAEQGLKILDGAKPGEMPWEYPRKYNIILNLAMAKLLGISFPQDLINAAYRVYTDLDGHYAGQGN